MSTPSSDKRVARSWRSARISIWRSLAAITTALLLALAAVPGSLSAAPASQELMSPSGLRDTLNFLGQEQIYLTSATMGDLLRGDTVAYDASLTRLMDSSATLADTIGAVYGPDAESTFRDLWQSHYDGLLEFALAKSAKDVDGKAQARANLDANRDEIGAFFASYNPYLRQADVSATLREHLDQMIGTIDAMGDEDWGKAFALTHMAAHQSADIMDPIAEGIARQFPDQFEGGVTGPAMEMSAAFTRLMQEHVFLASMSTSALAIGSAPKAQAAMATADANTRALSALIGKMYSEEVGANFKTLWDKHLDAYVDYTRAELAGDKESMDSARQFLSNWVTDTSALLTQANPFFSQPSVSSVLANHVSMTLSGIDAQVARDWQAAYSGLQMGAHQSLDLANIVAGGIVDAFGEQSGAQLLPPAPVQPQQAPVQLPRR